MTILQDSLKLQYLMYSSLYCFLLRVSTTDAFHSLCSYTSDSEATCLFQTIIATAHIAWQLSITSKPLNKAIGEA